MYPYFYSSMGSKKEEKKSKKKEEFSIPHCFSLLCF